MRKIKLFFAAMALLVTTLAYAQNINVTGIVTDSSNGEGIPFASIQLKGTTTGASTDVDGHFTVSVPANGTLVFSTVGYVTREVAVAGKANINVALDPDAEFLEETIVVAYGTATKSSFTGSAAMVKTEDIEKKIASNVTSALAGTTAGVQMLSSSGDPAGGGQTIRIRGIGSMSASSSPLIVVDGAPFEGAISDINPNDVESMSVLKDAAASAIYGARGANGVILITTKRGTKGDAQVKFDSRFGSNSRLIPNYDVITDPALYYETVYKLLYNKAYYANGGYAGDAYATADKQILDEKNGGLGYLVYTIPEGEKLIGTNFKLNPNAKLGYSDGEYYYIPDDWYNEVYHNSFRQEYNVSVNGNSDRFNYFASAGYLDDKGIVNNSDYKRYTTRINADYQVKKWIKVTTNMSFSHSTSISLSSTTWGSSGNLFDITNKMGPIYPLYTRDAQGNIMHDDGGHIIYDTNNTNFIRPSVVGNAVRDNEYDNANNIADVLTGKWGLILTPVKGLTLNGNISITDDNTRYNSLSSIFGSGAATDGYVYVSHSRMFTTNKQFIAQYDTDFGGSDHSIQLLAGYEDYMRTSQSLSGSNTHLFNPLVGEINNAKGEPADKSVSSSTSFYRVKGILSRAQYEYAGKYFASASFRRDASSRFAPGHQWGSFGSLGAAWLISGENFMSDVRWVNMLKFKLSYGVQGNDNLGSLYPYSDQYSSSYSPDSGYSTTLTYKGNEDLTWETSKNFNVGFDFELFKNYLNGSVELFSRKTEDLLYSKNVPLSAGNPTGRVPVNVGSIMNNGFEITLDGYFLRKRDFSWAWNTNISHYKNTILELDPSVSENGIKGSNYIYKVGGSLYESYMYQFAGVDQETGKGLYYYDVTDANGNVTKEITDNFTKATQYECGSTLPKLYGGFGTSLNFYGFDLSAQFQFQLGGKFYDGAYQNLMWTQSEAGSAMHKDLLKSWTPENPSDKYPRLDGDYTVAQSCVDRFFISSNYLSVNNVTLGYTVPQNIVKKAGLAALRVYVAGENLAVFSARKGVDPRFSQGLEAFNSESNSHYSSMRNITGGITLTF